MRLAQAATSSSAAANDLEMAQRLSVAAEGKPGEDGRAAERDPAAADAGTPKAAPSAGDHSITEYRVAQCPTATYQGSMQA